MAIDTDKKVALALLYEVEKNVEQTLGDQIVKPFDVHGYDADLDNFCKKSIRQIDLAEEKVPNNQEVLSKAYLLKAQLYGCWQPIQGGRGKHKKGNEYYQKLLEMGIDEPLVRYRYALFSRGALAGTGGSATENFKRVIELMGEDSELGIECAKELAKEESKKRCFIASAVYGSQNAGEVLLLRLFRDKVLLSSQFSSLLVEIYYVVSPSLAKVLRRNTFARNFVRIGIVHPIVNLVRIRLNANQKEE